MATNEDATLTPAQEILVRVLSDSIIEDMLDEQAVAAEVPTADDEHQERACC